MDRKDFETSDLGLASFLLALGFRLTHVNDEEPFHVVFVFGYEDGIDDLVALYEVGEAEVNAKRFSETLRDLKGYIVRARTKEEVKRYAQSNDFAEQ